MLREPEVHMPHGKSVKQVGRELGIAEQTHYRWRKEYGGVEVSQARHLKELEQQNAKLKRAVADLTPATPMLREALERNYLAPGGGADASSTSLRNCEYPRGVHVG